MIHIVCPSRYKISTKAIKQAVIGYLNAQKQPGRVMVNIIFIGTRKMRDIARTYKHEDVALPVLAFPYKELDLAGDHLLGEVFLCYPQVVLLAAERRKRVDDMINKLIEHGLENIIRDESAGELP